MAQISAKLVKQLRDMTGAGMMDCKKALVETGGDLEAAVEYLRKAGVAKAAKKLDREAKEGRVEAAINDDHKRGAMVELASETDFVARNEEFINFAQKLAKLALENAIKSTEELLNSTIDGVTVEEAVTQLVAKIGENIRPKRVAYFEAGEGGVIYQYVHPGNKIGVMVELSASPQAPVEGLLKLAKEIAMQIAFSKPVAIRREDVPEEILRKEREIYEEQARQEGKPEKAIEKIVEGRLRKFLQESCLLEQEYIRDAKLSVADLIAQASKELGASVEVRRFARFEVGAA